MPINEPLFDINSIKLDSIKTESVGGGTTTTTPEPLFKVVVMGDIGTGKTALIKKYVHNIFSMHYKSTIGVDFALKCLEATESTPECRLQLWDIAGQERFGNMLRVYLQESDAAIIVCDATRVSTIGAVEKWLHITREKIQMNDGSKLPVIILVNKCDLVVETGALKELADLAKAEDLKMYNISCKENEATNDIVTLSTPFRELTAQLVANQRAGRKSVSVSTVSTKKREEVSAVRAEIDNAFAQFKKAVAASENICVLWRKYSKVQDELSEAADICHQRQTADRWLADKILQCVENSEREFKDITKFRDDLAYNCRVYETGRDLLREILTDADTNKSTSD